MRPYVSRGYHVLPDDAVMLERWALSLADGTTYEMREDAPDWTCFHDIRITAALLTAGGDLASRAGLKADTAIGAVLIWSSALGIRGTSEVVKVEGSEVSMTAEIPAGAVANALNFEVRLILLEEQTSESDPMVARLPGSILWSNAQRIRLEGDAPRIPVMAVGLGGEPFYNFRHARWFVDIEATELDLSAPVDAGVRVFVNEANHLVSRMLHEPTSEASAAIVSALHLDVQRELVRSALREDSAYDPALAYPDGSLGAAMRSALDSFNDDFDELQAKAAYAPAQFDIEIQGRLGDMVDE